ncbi:hypothetical protein JNUCC64_14335 [Streptomyces sp. JNUCC 64]
MTRDALLGGPPVRSGAHCCVCGCWTTAPVEIGYTNQSGTGYITHHVCPHDINGGQCTVKHHVALG